MIRFLIGGAIAAYPWFYRDYLDSLDVWGPLSALACSIFGTGLCGWVTIEVLMFEYRVKISNFSPSQHKGGQ